MSAFDQEAVDLFKMKAGPVSITVAERKNLSEAMVYALNLHRREDRPGLLAAPGWPPEIFKELKSGAEPLGFEVVTEGLRNYPAGFELAFTAADLAIAATATCVVRCPGEDLRLATMLGETHVLALPKARVVREAYQAEDFLGQALGEEAMYAAFISGPSRTADIERVLTLGVHGPLAVHVVLLEDLEGRLSLFSDGQLRPDSSTAAQGPIRGEDPAGRI